MFRRIWLRCLMCGLVIAAFTGCGKKDLNDPVIVIEGDNPLFLALGSEWVLPPYSASDMEDGDLTDEVTIENENVLTDQIGEWNVVFSVSDNAGNRASDTLHVYVGMDLAAYAGDYTVEEIRDVDGDGILGEADVIDEIAGYAISITAGPEQNSLLIDNLGDYGNGVETILYFAGNLKDQLSLDDFIPDDDGIHLTGSGMVTTGSISSVIISFEYEAEDGGLSVPCESQFIKN